jgi:hypothetical protein
MEWHAEFFRFPFRANPFHTCTWRKYRCSRLHLTWVQAAQRPRGVPGSAMVRVLFFSLWLAENRPLAKAGIRRIHSTLEVKQP